MVNHVKTLLLNATFDDVSEAGVDFYVDPSFNKLDIPSYFEKALEYIIPLDAGIEDRLHAIDSIFSIVARVDLADRLSIYDSRITKPYTEEGDVFVTDVATSCSDFDSFMNPRYDSLIFKLTGDEAIDEELNELKTLYSSDNDGHKRVAVKILALVAQLENIRRHS